MKKSSRGRIKDCELQGHVEITNAGKAFEDHKRLAKFGIYAQLSDEAIRVLGAIGLAADAKKRSEGGQPGAIEEFERTAALAGKFLVECLERPSDGAAILEAVAAHLGLARRQAFTLLEFPGLVLPDKNGLAVKVKDAMKIAEERGLAVPRVPDSKPIDEVRFTIAMQVGFWLSQDPDRRFSVTKLRSFFDGWQQPPSDTTIRRAAHDLGVPLPGAGAPRGTKQRRVGRQKLVN